MPRSSPLPHRDDAGGGAHHVVVTEMRWRHTGFFIIIIIIKSWLFLLLGLQIDYNERGKVEATDSLD